MSDEEHPRQHMRFFGGGEWAAEAERRVSEALDGLAASRSWTLGPPTYVLSHGELSGELTLHSAFPPWGDRLPIQTDEAELEQARALISVLADASVHLGTVIALDMDDDPMGEIVDGQLDAGISEVLLGEWARTIEKRRSQVRP